MDKVTSSTDQQDRQPIKTSKSAATERSIVSVNATNKDAGNLETNNGNNNTVTSGSNLTRHDQQPSQQQRTIYCRSCQQPCSRVDQSLIRALGEVYHYDCFRCEDCRVLVADKFYALNTNHDTSKFKIVCEHHYYAQNGILCPQCQQLTRTGNNESTNPLSKQCQCQTRCPGCMMESTENAEKACYEYDGRVYCLVHFSSIKEIQCFGCLQAVLKQFVEHKSHPGQKWHPECYMIFKFWNVRLADTLHTGCDEKRTMERLEDIQTKMEQKANRIWTDLSSFEESSATCISDMLLLVAAGAYVEGFRMASQFVMHLEVLYGALDDIQQQLILHDKVLPCGKESKLVCDQVIRFFNLLTQSDNKKMGSLNENGLGVTQELLFLITSLAQNLKTLIRIGLTEVLYLERDCHVADAIPTFLNNLLELDRKRVWIGGRYWFKEDPFPKLLDSPSFDISHQHEVTASMQCHSCQQPIYGECYQHTNQEMWHYSCFACSKCQHPLSSDLSTGRPHLDSDSNTLLCDQCTTPSITSQQSHHDTTKSSFVHLTELQHYLYLLKLALARLYFAMNSSSSVPFDKHSGIYERNHDRKTRNTSLLPPVSTVPVTNNNQPPSYQQQQQQQRNDSSRTSFFGSVHFGNIKRVKSAHLDRITEHPHDSLFPNNSSDISATIAPPKRSFTVFEPKKIMPHHRNYSADASSPSSSTDPLKVNVQHDKYDLASPTTPQPTSLHIGSGIFSTTRRASTNTIQRMGSLRRALSQRSGPERGSVYNLFGRRQSQKLQPLQQLHEQQPQQAEKIFDSASAPSVVNKDLRITTAPPQSLRSSSISSHSSILVDSPIATSASMSSLVYHQLLPLSPNQYQLVRYITAKTIPVFAPPNMYTVEEWMLLVECRKTSLWGKFKTRIRTSHIPSADHQHIVHHQKVFGVSLDLLTSGTSRLDLRKRNQSDALSKYIGTNNLDDTDMVKANHTTTQWVISCFTSIHCKIPCFVQHCVLALLQRDLSVEGIFRKNGNIRELKQMEEIIDKDTTVGSIYTVDTLSKQTSIQLAALLKRFLRELPEPLLTFRLYPVFVAAVGLETEEEVKIMLHLACCMLPKENRDTMQVIFGFLQHVSTFKDTNKMGVYNLARIMAPSVLHDRSALSSQDMSSTNNSSMMADRTPVEEIKVVDMLIRYHDEFGKTPGDMIPFISDPKLVEWFAGMESKRFIKNYTELMNHGYNKSSYPPRIQQSSEPTLSTTTANSSDAVLSPTAPGRKQSNSVRSQPASPINPRTPTPFMPLMPEPGNTTLSTASKSFHRRSWMLRKQQHA